MKKIIQKKFILRRAKNNRKREYHVSAASYLNQKESLIKEANEYAQRVLGYKSMSISAYINIKLLLP